MRVRPPQGPRARRIGIDSPRIRQQKEIRRSRSKGERRSDRQAGVPVDRHSARASVLSHIFTAGTEAEVVSEPSEPDDEAIADPTIPPLP